MKNRFLHKNGRISNQSTLSRQPDKLLQCMQHGDGTTSLTLHPEQEIRALKGGPSYWWHLRRSSRTSFPSLALREKSPRARNTGSNKEWRLKNVKSGNEIGITTTFTRHNFHFCFIHHQERRAQSAKLRTWFVHNNIWMSKSSQNLGPPDLPWK